MDIFDAPKVVPATAFGRRFRSTTEARWAVFLTELGIPWEYEQETYDLGSLGWYLPDFWLTREGWFLEIKPGRPRMLDEDYDKAKALHLATHRPVLIANGFGGPPDVPSRPDDAPGWIYDMFDARRIGDPEPVLWGGPGYRLFASTCGRAALGLPAVRKSAGYEVYRHDARHDCVLVRWRDALEAATSYRPDWR